LRHPPASRSGSKIRWPSLQFCCPSVMLGDAATRLSPTEGTREHKSTDLCGAQTSGLCSSKTQSLDEGLAALNLAQNNTSKAAVFRNFNRFSLLRCES